RLGMQRTMAGDPDSAEADFELFQIERHPRLAGRHYDSPEIRIAYEERRLDQRRVGDLARDPLRVGSTARAPHLDRDELGRAFAVAHQLAREHRSDLGCRRVEGGEVA